MNPPARCAALLLGLLPVVIDQDKEKEDREEAVRALLGRSDELSPEVRADIAQRLAALGPEALPFLEKALDGGNRSHARLAALALAIGSPRSSFRDVLQRGFLRRQDRDLDLVVPLGMALAGAGESARVLSDALLDRRTEPLLRIAAALALGRSGFGDEAARCRTALLMEENPIVAGALGLGFGVGGVESSIQALREKLARAREAPERAGLYLGLAALGRRELPSASDLAAADPVLPLAAVLHFVDEPVDPGGAPAAAWTRVVESPDGVIRGAAYAALGRGSEPRSLARLGRAIAVEVDPRVRAAIYGAAALRREAPILKAGRADPDDRASRFVAAALLALAAPDRTKDFEGDLLPAARAELESADAPSAAAAALLLAAARDPGSEESLKRAAGRGDSAWAALLALKNLRGELDPRAFADVLRRRAFDQGVLFERWVAEAAHRFALLALGAESDFLGRRRDPSGGVVPAAWIARGRKPPRDAPIYEDLWILLERRPFDRSLLGSARRGRPGRAEGEAARAGRRARSEADNPLRKAARSRS